MSSSIVQRFSFAVAGEPIDFSNPFIVPSLTLAEPPIRAYYSIAASATATLWSGSPLPSTFDVFALITDQSLDVEFSVNSGASLFTLFARAGGFPLVLQGDDSYVSGNLSGTLGVITQIRAKNRNTETAANVQTLLGVAA